MKMDSEGGLKILDSQRTGSFLDVSMEFAARALRHMRVPLLRRLLGRQSPPAPAGAEVFVADRETLRKVIPTFNSLPFVTAVQPGGRPETTSRPREHDGLHRAFLKQLGNLPERITLEARCLGIWDYRDYTQEKVCFQSSPDQFVPAYLLVPKTGAPPFPAVVVVHGHSSDLVWGKTMICVPRRGTIAAGYGVRLLQRGYVVIAIDLVGFEERKLTPVQEKTPWRQDMERLIFCSLLLQGATLAGLNLFDLSRAVDYLHERTDVVDPDRIGVIGHSMGGSLTPLLMLFDGRIRVGVSAAGLSTWRAMMAHQVIHNFAVYIPGLLEISDLDEFLTLIAPRPFLMIAGEQDPNFPIEGVHDVAKAMRARYETLGCPDAFEVYIHPGGHPFETSQQEAALTFLDRWLRNVNSGAGGGQA